MPKIVLSRARQQHVLNVIDSWEGKLTWPLIIRKLSKKWKLDTINRHTFRRYSDIMDAFKEKQTDIRDSGNTISEDRRPLSAREAEKKIKKLESQVSRLERENERLKTKFVRWQKNAYMTPGFAIKEIAWDKPLVDVSERGRE